MTLHSRRCMTIGLIALASGLSILAPARATAQAGPYQFYSLTPCRVIDTRPLDALTSGVQRNLTIKSRCGIPLDAAAVALNLTVVTPTLSGFVTLWPYGTSLPSVSTINFAANEPALANGAIVSLGSDPTSKFHLAAIYGVASGTGTVHVLIDVSGYFR